MKSTFFQTIAIIISFLFICWNIYLSIAISKFKKHPDKIEIFIDPTDSIATDLKAIQELHNISIIVPDYENNLVNESIGILNTASNFFGKSISALAIFLSILAAFGLYEINNWRKLRVDIEEGEEKVVSLSDRVQESIEEIETKKNTYERKLIELNENESSFNNKILQYKEELNTRNTELAKLAASIRESQDEMVSNNALFERFTASIYKQYNDFGRKFEPRIKDELRSVKDANASTSDYSESLKNLLKDYLMFYNSYGFLLQSISEKEASLLSFDNFALGIASYINKNNQDAITFFQKALENNSQDHVAYYKLGAIYYYVDDFEAAIDCSKKACSINSKFYAPYFNMGRAYTKINKYDEAIKSYKKAIELNKNYIAAYNGLGTAYIVLERYEEAIEILDHSIKLDNTNYLGFYNKACLFSRLKNKIEALLYLKKSITLDNSMKIEAKKDTDFEWLWNDFDFLKLIDN